MMYKHEIPEYVSDAFSARKNDYCVCVFVINEGERLHKQLEKMRNVCAGVADIVVADGGSTDGSTEHDYLKSQNVRALLVKKSVGKLGTQMRMAFDWALKEGYQGVVVVDGNGKDGIDAIPRFVEELKNGVDHVQGSRFIPGGHHENTPLSRLLGVKLLHSPLMTIASGFRYTDTTNGFRAYSRKLLESPEVDVFRECFSGYELHYYLAIEAARLGFKVKEIPVSRVYPAKGKTPTKISFFKGNFGVLERLFTVCRGEYSHRKTMWSRLTNMSGTQRLFLAFLATFIITTGICIGTWNSLGGQVWQYPDYLFRNGERSGALPPLRQGVTYSQSFTAERDGLNLIELAIACYGRTNNFTLSAVIRDMSDKRVVVSKKIPASTLVETARNKIEFPRIEQSRGKTYRLELHGEGYVSKEDAITIWTRPAISFPCVKVNDREFGEARMIMAFSYLPVYRLHDTILHSETLGLLGVLFLYAIWVVSRRKSINSDSWEKYFYPLLFVVGIGVLMARSASLIAIPDLYTEDAMWSGRIMGRGFGNTFLHARPDYFVSGNVLSLGIGLLINKICFGCNMFYYPIVLVFVQFVIYTLTALLPVVCFRRNVGFLYRLLIFAAFMLLSAGTPGCNYEIFGKVSNIGYIFPFISFCGLVHIYNSHRTIGFVQLALWAVCIQICYMTNPVSNLVVFFFFCMNVLVEMGLSGHSRSQSKEEEMWNWHALLSPIDGIRRLFGNRFFWFTCVLGCQAVATIVLQKLILESGIARHSAVMEVTDARIVEALCRFFYPLLAIFYHSLTAVFGTIVLLLVLGSLLSALKLRRTEILFPMLLLVMLSYMASSLYFRAGELIGRSGDYAGTFPFRYAYGVTLFCICAYVMAIEAFLRRRQASFKLAALSMLVVMVGSVLNVIASRKYEIRQMHPEHEQYISSFVDHKDVIRETVLVSVPNVQHNWHIEMPFVNFKATQDFLLKNYHECRIPTLDRMFSKENMYWKNCISKTRSAFYVHNTEENRKKFHKGAKIVLPAPYGERTIEGTREDRIFFDVYLSGTRLATDKAIDFDKCVVKYVE